MMARVTMSDPTQLSILFNLLAITDNLSVLDTEEVGRRRNIKASHYAIVPARLLSWKVLSFLIGS